MRTIKKHRLNGLTKSLDSQRVFMVNDLHFKAGTDGNPNSSGAVAGTRYYYTSPTLLRKFVETVNNEKPDMVLLLGDVCDIPSDWDLFNGIWSGINAEIETVITIGNHDFDDHTYSELLPIIGYENNEEIGGSKFNQTFVKNGYRYIILDATFNGLDEHGTHFQEIRFHTSTLPWLESVLSNATEKRIIVGTHVAPHHENFNSQQRGEIELLLSRAKLVNPTLNTTWVFGHHHVWDVMPFTNLGESNAGYLLPAMILGLDGRFTELTISDDVTTLLERDIYYA